jgi:hypothetical protein
MREDGRSKAVLFITRHAILVAEAFPFKALRNWFLQSPGNWTHDGGPVAIIA